MNVPFLVKVPVDLAVQLRGKVDQLRVIHTKEITSLERNMKGGDGRAIAKLAALKARGRRISVPHLLRACIARGRSVLDGKPTDLLNLVAHDTVVRGRPRVSRAS